MEAGLAAIPTAIYGFVLLMAAIAYYVLQRTIIAKEGRQSVLAEAVGMDSVRCKFLAAAGLAKN